MKELDFDELDRAVNSLMTDVPKTSTPQEDEQVKTLTITPSASGNAPVAVSPTTPSTAPALVPAPAASAAARRGGRFMDVVHPSANMKKAEVSRTPVSRQGVTIAPVSRPDVAPEPTPSASPSVQPPVESKKPETPAVPETSSPVSEWPDPLELANFKDESPEEKADIVKDHPEASPAALDTTEEPAPLTSPFLPDTKVEKRPLGNPAVASESSLPDQDGDQGKEGLTVDDPNAQLPASPPEEAEIPLPEELQGDLVAIESGASGKKVAPLDEHEEEDKEEASTPPEVKAPAPVEETPATPKAKEPTPAAPTGPASIPQQYREEPSTGDQENGAIYDTDTYHQPLTHPGKKKSGWLWVVWILLILLVGAGIGAALFFLKIV
jgi:hypothetical protein